MWVNGRPETVLSLRDRALHYGDGLFETIAIADGQPQLLTAHLQRLQSGCRRLSLPYPDEDLLRQEIAAASRAMAVGRKSVLKLILSRGEGGRGYRPPQIMEPVRILMSFPWPYHDEEERCGVRLRYCSTPLSSHPQLAGIKHLNRLEQVIARNEWQNETIFEGLMANGKGSIVEGTMSNIFWLRSGRIFTPELKECGVQGVMRQEVMTLAEEEGIACEITSCERHDLEEADGLFITNSLLKIRWVRQLQQKRYPQLEIIRHLQQKLEKRLAHHA
ncbi:MAG: aminodeoxychorismate lyase [Gammaproteobacteria bacterium]|nr:aminodeoxychorismate lyase [Gammaproteobacteria bacterium]